MENQPMFTVMKDRNNFEHKVVNFANEAICPRKGKREITSIRKTNRHQVTSSFTRIVDKETGITYGIPLGIDPKTGELKFQRIIIEDHMYFDLSVESERKLFIVLSYAPFVAKSPLGQGKPRFRIVNKEEDAEKILYIHKNKKSAEAIIETLTTLQQYDMARNLSMPVDQMSAAMITAELFEYVAKKPRPGLDEKSGAENFLEMYHNSNREIITVLNRCISTGVIKFDLANGFVTNKGIPLGNNQIHAVKYLLSNTSLLLALDQESKEKDRYIKEYATEDDFKSNILEQLSKDNKSPLFVNEKEIDKTMEDLYNKNKETEDRLAKKEAKLDQMMEMLEKKLNEPAPEQAVKIVTGVDVEYENLKEKAIGLGIKSPHLYKKDNLKEKIAEVEQNFDLNQ